MLSSFARRLSLFFAPGVTDEERDVYQYCFEMIATALNYYSGAKLYEFSALITNALAHDTFGMDYAQALELYYDTQAWTDFETIVTTHGYLASFAFEWTVAFCSQIAKQTPPQIP